MDLSEDELGLLLDGLEWMWSEESGLRTWTDERASAVRVLMERIHAALRSRSA